MEVVRGLGGRSNLPITIFSSSAGGSGQVWRYGAERVYGVGVPRTAPVDTFHPIPFVDPFSPLPTPMEFIRVSFRFKSY